MPGDAHSQCIHAALDLDPAARLTAGALMLLRGSIDLPIPGAPGGRVTVRFDQHGIANGWASWPFNFDPVWLQECTLFEPLPVAPTKESTDAE